MWAVGRRTGFFFVSYVPLAAMFVVAKWPSGWESSEIVGLAIWLTSIAVLVLLLPSLTMSAGKAAKLGASILVCGAIAVFVLGLAYGWYEPMGLHPDKPKTAATVSGIAFFLVVMGLLIVAVLLHNARRVSEVRWTVVDPRDQGGAVAGYLATYLLPLLSISAQGWRTAAAYGIYFITLYLVFIRTESLVLVNPTLYVLNYRIYDVEIDARDAGDRRRVLILTKSQVARGIDVDVVPLGDRCYLAKEVTR